MVRIEETNTLYRYSVPLGRRRQVEKNIAQRTVTFTRRKKVSYVCSSLLSCTWISVMWLQVTRRDKGFPVRFGIFKDFFDDWDGVGAWR